MSSNLYYLKTLKNLQILSWHWTNDIEIAYFDVDFCNYTFIVAHNLVDKKSHMIFHTYKISQLFGENITLTETQNIWHQQAWSVQHFKF